MKKIIFLLFAYTANISAEQITYGSIFELKSERIGNIVARYLITRDNHPCLNIEILDPEKNWSISSKKKICTFEEKSFMTGFTDASFENIAFSKEGLHATLSITRLRISGEELFECLIPIKENRIGDLRCSPLE